MVMRWKMMKLRKLRGVPKPTIAALSVAVRAADRAGEIIREGYYQAQEIQDKGHGDLVSQVDIKCGSYRPGSNLCEGYPRRYNRLRRIDARMSIRDHTKYWVVDPLDRQFGISVQSFTRHAVSHDRLL